MLNNLFRYWTPVTIILILALIAGSFFVPVWTDSIGLIVLTLSLSIATFSVVQRQIRMNRRGPASKIRLTWNILLEFVGILLAIFLAGLFGRYAAGMFTNQIGDEMIKLISGIIIGLLTGLVVGILVQRAWGRLLEVVT